MCNVREYDVCKQIDDQFHTLFTNRSVLDGLMCNYKNVEILLLGKHSEINGTDIFHAHCIS